MIWKQSVINWYRTEDKLPSENEEVLVKFNNDNFNVMMYHTHFNMWKVVKGNSYEEVKETLWCKLPSVSYEE